MKKSTYRSGRWNRRDFLKSTAAAAAVATFGVPTLLRGQNLNSKLNIAAIGAGGKGSSDINCVDSENIYALCDADLDNSAEQRKKHPDAKFYRDFRKMLDESGKSIDAVMVSTPDHFHAIAAAAAMRLGKHVYCQKPLVQTIYEARYLRTLAHDTKVITQMGNQGSSNDGLRRAVEVVQAGLIGPVRQVHVWTNRPIWPQGMTRPDGSDPVPDSLDWDIWLGPAAFRQFKKDIYQPFVWRGWQDFGTGALGDMACHTVNMPFRATGFGYPTEIEAEIFGAPNKDSYPIGSKIRFEFPARKITIPAPHRTFFHRHDTIDQVATTFWWYDGGQPLADNPTKHDGTNKPPREITADVESLLGEIPGSGCILIGDKGMMTTGTYGEQTRLNPAQEKMKDYKFPDPLLTRSPGHYQDWIRAAKGGDPASSNFNVAVPFVSWMLLGVISQRVEGKLEWDAVKGEFSNNKDANQFLKPPFKVG